MDFWLYLFKNISQLKVVPDKFIGTPFQKIIELLGQEKADWIRELEENEVLKDIRKREVDEIVGEASKISFEEGVEYGQELGIKKGLEQGLEEGLEQGREQGREERRKLLQKIIAQLRAEGYSDQKLQSMLNIDPEDL